MRRKYALSLLIVGLVCTWMLVAPAGAQAQEKPIVKIPQSGVPQIMTMEGKFVRAASRTAGTGST